MLRQSVRVQFPGSLGFLLGGILDLPSTEPRAYLLFAHCFTCTKDIKAVVRISRYLAECGYGVLRFDFTGLGDSGGNFAATNFQSNQADLRCAALYLAEQYQAPVGLLGLSLGGAAALSVADELSSVRCVVTLAAPSDTHHLAYLLRRMDSAIVSSGSGQVTIGGKTHRIDRQMVENLEQFDLTQSLARLTKPLLVFHSPADETVGIEHAMRILALTSQASPQSHHPRAGTSFICLPGSDHLMINHPADLVFVSKSIAVWLERILAS